MHLVLCHVADVSAVRAYEALRLRADGVVECITVEALCAGLQWEHRLGSASAGLRIRLADGRMLDGLEIDSVLNRVHSPAPIGAGQAAGDDGEYATQEFAAFFLSWLASLDAVVVNEPTPQGLAGRLRSAIEWTWLAREVGLPIMPRLETTPSPMGAALGRGEGGAGHAEARALVVGDRVVAPSLDSEVMDGCRALALRAGVKLLGVSFAPTAHGVVFVGATPTPHLRIEDDGVVDSLCEVLGIGQSE